jgi:hypothetical protein
MHVCYSVSRGLSEPKLPTTAETTSYRSPHRADVELTTTKGALHDDAKQRRSQQEMNLMAALIKTYPNEHAASLAVEALRAAGVPPRDIRLLTSEPLHDSLREQRGGFAGPVGPDAPVGTYAGRVRRRGQGVGSFATGSFAGDPDQQREGSFADVERVVIVIYDDGAERTRITGYRGVPQLLRRAALDDDAVDRAVKDLHIGRAVVLVAEVAPSDARAQLERVEQAA